MVYQYTNVNLFVANLFHIPLVDSSMDLLYTCYAIEPNGGKEKEILQEIIPCSCQISYFNDTRL